MVYFGSFDSYLYAVDIKSGQEKWKFQTGGEVVVLPGHLGRGGLFGSWDGYLYAVDIQTGQEKWKFQTGRRLRPPRPSLTGWSTSAVLTAISTR